MTDLVLIDNTVLSNVARVGAAHLPVAIWQGAAFTTPAVLTELRQGQLLGVIPPVIDTFVPLLDPTETETAFENKLPRRLGPGERSCLAVAYHRGASVATDDYQARSAASRLAIPLTGTVGLLVRGVSDGVLSRDDASDLLRRMIEAGYRSPVERLEDVLP